MGGPFPRFGRVVNKNPKCSDWLNPAPSRVPLGRHPPCETSPRNPPSKHHWVAGLGPRPAAEWCPLFGHEPAVAASGPNSAANGQSQLRKAIRSGQSAFLKANGFSGRPRPGAGVCNVEFDQTISSLAGYGPGWQIALDHAIPDARPP